MGNALETILARTPMVCTKCGAAAGTCKCWESCRCGWTNKTGGACGNPVHGMEEIADEAAHTMVMSIVFEMQRVYPEPMKSASGGFRKTLIAVAKYEAREMVLAILRELAPNAKDAPHV